MNIKKTDTLNFTGYTNIKTKTPAILNALEDCDFEVWRKIATPECRYTQAAQGGPGKDGFFQGVLQDGEEATKPLISSDIGDKFIVQEFEDLEKIPALKKFMPQIKAYYDRIINPNR